MAQVRYAGPVVPGNNEEYFRTTGQLSNPFYGPVQTGQSTAQFRAFGQDLAPSTGSVGASDGFSSGGGGGSLPSIWQANVGGQNQVFANQQEYNNALGSIRNNINSGYDQFTNTINNQIGGLGGEQQNYYDQIQGSYGSQKSGLDTSRANTNAELDSASQKVSDRKASSIRDLESNIRNQLYAGQVMLGSRGAGDSSAVNQYNYALTQQGNKNRSQLLKEANASQADIDLRRNQVTNTYNDNINQLDNWVGQQKLQVAQYISDKRAQLQQMLANGQIERGQALAALDQQIMQNAYSRLQQVEAQQANFKNSLMQWALNNSSNIQQAQNAIAQYGQVADPTFSAGTLPSLAVDSNVSQTNPYTGYAAGPNRRYDPLTGQYV